MIREKKRWCPRYMLGAVALGILVMAIIIIVRSVEEKELVTEIEEAIQFDIYLWAKGKEKFVGTSDIYQEGVGSTFGEAAYVFEDKISLDDIEQFTYDAGILLKFRYPGKIWRINIYCHEISDPSILSNDARNACFVDKETGALYLVQVGDEFYKVKDKSFFSDIKSLLKMEYGIE